MGADANFAMNFDKSERLTRLDVASWLSPNQQIVDMLLRIKDSGIGVALLSNAFPTLVNALEQLNWLKFAVPRFYSSRLNNIKPRQAVFEQTAAMLGAHVTDCIFLDDRRENAKGAEAVGMQALVVNGARELRSELQKLGLIG